MKGKGNPGVVKRKGGYAATNSRGDIKVTKDLGRARAFAANPSKTRKRVSLKNFTGTITRNKNGTVTVRGKGRKK